MDPRDSLKRAHVYLSQHGNSLQQNQVAALLAQRPLTPDEAAALMAGQRPEGGWSAFWSAGRCSVDATCYRITQALAAGLSPARCLPLQSGAAWLEHRQRPAGFWQEDDALTHDAPPWARPADTSATLYLTANAGWVMARCGYALSATLAARALAERLGADDALPSFAHTQWIAAGLWLLRGDEALAARALGAIQAHTSIYSAGQLIWLLNCLLDSGLARTHPLISDACARLCALQQADGSWPSDDGSPFTPQVTLEAMRALALLSA
jgi:hypothetical protein